MSVVIATRDRPASLARTLDRLAALRPAVPVIVVDNASAGGVGWAAAYPAVRRLVTLDRNRGAAAARNVGARLATTRYVAFSDDDSWWAAGALPAAADALDRYPRLALVAARTLVGPGEQPDPVNRLLAGSPLPDRGDLPGRPVLGCLACAAVVRRDPFLAVGGFPELLEIGGEETPLCYDLVAAGWGVRYLSGVVAHHHPWPERPDRWRREALLRRNQVLIRWLRRPLPVAVAGTGRLALSAARDRAARLALAGLFRRLPAALATRRRLPAVVERDIRRLERTGDRP